MASGNRTVSVAAAALGVVVLGAFAIGAMAIGAVAIGQLGIGRVRFERRLEIDELIVRKLTIVEQASADALMSP